MPHRPGTSVTISPVFLFGCGNYRCWACFEIALLAVGLLMILLWCFLRLGTPLHSRFIEYPLKRQPWKRLLADLSLCR